MAMDLLLAESDVRLLLGAVWACDEASSVDVRLEQVLDALVRLVPADVVFWNCFDVAPRLRTHGLVGASLTGPPKRAPLGPWLEHLGEHPVMSCRFGPVVAVSDVWTQPELEASWLWQEAWQPAGVRHELGLELSHPGSQVNVVVWSRGSGRDFDERDRLVLRLLRPHVDAAVRRLSAPALTERQRQVLRLVRDGCSDAQIARRLGVAEATIGKHLERIYVRTGARNRAQVVALTTDLID